jgi:uncharacterized protein (UPF0548 family)
MGNVSYGRDGFDDANEVIFAWRFPKHVGLEYVEDPENVPIRIVDVPLGS